jgi:ATP-binding cassette subfamily F protein 3
VDDQAFHFNFMPTKPASYPMIKMDADCGYGDTVIVRDAKVTMSPQDRIGIIGVNGAGKSTFLKSLAKTLDLVSGEVTHVPNLTIGFYTQQQVENFNVNETPLDVLQSAFPYMGEGARKSLLGQFNFTFDQMNQRIADFSGGERARLALACLVQQQPQLLILDEPTNHLDMPMREALIEALQTYEGAVLLVSHDRHLLECVTDQYWIVANQQIHTFEGSLDAYAQLILDKAPAGTKKSEKKASKKNKSSPKKGPSLEKLEKDIAACEAAIKACDAELVVVMETAGHDATQLAELSDKRGALVTKLDALQDTWLARAEDA